MVTVFQAMAPCKPAEADRHFRGAYCLLTQRSTSTGLYSATSQKTVLSSSYSLQWQPEILPHYILKSYHHILIYPNTRRVFSPPIFAFETLGFILNSHTKENIPADSIFLCCTLHTTIACVFQKERLVLVICTRFCRLQQVNFSFAFFTCCMC